MNRNANFDLNEAHKYFAANCFNAAWDLIEKKERTAQDDRMMVSLSYASIFHWSQRPDCDDEKLATGYWQASRIQCEVGHPMEAARLGEICLAYSKNLPPFFLAHAHEALARAQKQLGRVEEAALHLAEARRQLDLVTNEENRDRLAADLRELA